MVKGFSCPKVVSRMEQTAIKIKVTIKHGKSPFQGTIGYNLEGQ